MFSLKHEILNKNPKKTSEIALRAFFVIMDKWKVNKSKQLDLLGKPSELSLNDWEQGHCVILSNETLVHISYILGIYKALDTIFIDKTIAAAWVSKKNKVFGGKSALEYIMQDSLNHLSQVRIYLDSQI